MTMTLGFNAHGYFEALFAEDVAQALIVALAKHAPGGRLRIGEFSRDGYQIHEVDRTGKETPCAEREAIAAAIAEASYVSWANSDAPTASPILLPGTGWDLKALRTERVFENERVKFHFEAAEIAKARPYFEASCAELFDVAEKHGLVLVFR